MPDRPNGQTAARIRNKPPAEMFSLQRTIRAMAALTIATLTVAFPNLDNNLEKAGFASTSPEIQTRPLPLPLGSVHCDPSSGVAAFYSPSASSGQCVRLLERGPDCAHDHWLVLKASSEAEAVAECRPRPCDGDHVAYSGQCLPLRDTGLCPNGTHLLSNYHGEGECDCLPGLLPYAASPDAAVECHAAGERGPCADGHVLVDLSAVSDEDDVNLTEDGDYSALSFGTRCSAASEAAIGFRGGLITLPETCPPGKALDSNGECRVVFDFREATRPKVARRIDTRKKDWKELLRRRFG